ncbi:hypothetical protein LOTGIDRAFT_238970 [Lottia gigantea]|uniref:Perlustrin-like protein n=2 Tax=Lottia gigantea TaxID=225164 RepID=PLSLP_LOTGI|nr:hypothetical protein LOTGIDRAFT_238970 [Lottia gigantea]B3A0Q9.1 RecName: Full=Perlustrin-like protein; Flags: Precursor [Lottia gigantea]ESO98695.1 hypothetical protein LOTGIDRAFT_238970 [Lottia gigantea]
MKFGVGFLLSCLVALNTVQNMLALSCLPCDFDTLKCSPLPDDDDCFPAYTPCGCCPQCAGEEDDFCDNFTVRCHPDLVCVNATGFEKKFVYWYEFDFKGTCQESELETEYEYEYEENETKK